MGLDNVFLVVVPGFTRKERRVLLTAAALPKLAHSIGRAKKEFKKGLEEDAETEDSASDEEAK